MDIRGMSIPDYPNDAAQIRCGFIIILQLTLSGLIEQIISKYAIL